MARLRWVMAACGVGMLSSTCLPVVNPGYLSMTPRAPGKVDLQAQAGGGYPHLGWGALHVEPYATPRLSVPIGVIGTYPGAGAARVGLRYRLGGFLSLGGGAGVSFIYENHDNGYTHGAAVLADLEIGLGHRWRRFGLSFAFRPTYHGIGMIAFPVGLATAFFVSEHWAISLLVHGGCGAFFGELHGVGWAGGGGIGILGQL